jgi:LysR family transcriptional regulator, regulator of abg operon
MKLSQLRDLIVIAEKGSLRAAARALGVSTPALVKSINGLEAELHVPLLVRGSRGVRLSEYGGRFLHRARLIDAETRRAADEIAELRGQFEGAITVGASPTPSVTLLPEALLQFRRKFPSVQVNIVGGLYHAHLKSIRAGAMDLALGPIPDAGLDAAFCTEELFYNDIVIAARKSHPLAGARSLRNLAACEWVMTGPDTQGPGAAIFDAFRMHGLGAPRRVIQCDITWALQTLLLKSDLMCALPRQLLEHGPLRDLLRVVNVREALPRYRVSLIYRSDAPLLPTSEYFATLLRRQARHVGRRYPSLVAHGARG